MTTDHISRVPLNELEFSFSKSSGPGGQNVNKVNSKATLFWNIVESEVIPKDVKERFSEHYGNRINSEGQVVIASDTRREQEQNKQECIERLENMLQECWLPPKKRFATKPTRTSVKERLETKKIIHEKKKARQKISTEES